MSNKPLYRALASLIAARANCAKTGNLEWKANHEDKAIRLARGYLPSGSGFDCGTAIDLDASTAEKLVLRTSYHHMNESGMYDGWTEHAVTIRPSLLHGFTLRVSGRDRDGVKDYIAEMFEHALDAVVLE